MTDDEALRRAADGSDRTAMVELVQRLTDAGRTAEAEYWTHRLEELRREERSIAVGGRRLPPVLLVGAAVVAALGLVCGIAAVALVAYALRLGGAPGVAVLLLAAVLGADALAFLWAAAGIPRGALSAVRLAQQLAAVLGVLTICVLLLVLAGVLSPTPAAVVTLLVAVGSLIGLAAFLGRCIPWLGVARRDQDRHPSGNGR